PAKIEPLRILLWQYDAVDGLIAPHLCRSRNRLVVGQDEFRLESRYLARLLIDRKIRVKPVGRGDPESLPFLLCVTRHRNEITGVADPGQYLKPDRVRRRDPKILRQRRIRDLTVAHLLYRLDRSGDLKVILITAHSCRELAGHHLIGDIYVDVALHDE